MEPIRKMSAIPKLGSEWLVGRLVLDVCAFRRPDINEKIAIHPSHLHPDHVILPGELVNREVVFKGPPILLSELQEEKGYQRLLRMNPNIDFEEYTDVVGPLPHTSYSPKQGKRVVTDSFGRFFPGDVLFVPECDDPKSIIQKYRPKVSIVMASARSRRFQVNFYDYMDVDILIDNRIWFWQKHEDNVMPKVFFSCTREDKYSFAERGGFVYTSL